MHHALAIPEVRLLIVQNIQFKSGRPHLKTLASLARTCKTFFESVIPILWKKGPNILHLLLTFPSDLCKTEEIICDGMEFMNFTCLTFKREMKASDWVRWDVYSKWVTTLEVSDVPKYTIIDDIYETMARSRAVDSWFPNLHTLSSTASWSQAAQVFSENLIDLKGLILPYQRNEHCHSGVMALLRRRCLEIMDCHDILWRMDEVEEMAFQPSLRKLSTETVPFPWVLEDISVNSKESGFLCLQDLTTNCPRWGDTEKLLRGFQHSPIQRLEIDAFFDSYDDIQSDLSLLANSPLPLKEVILDVQLHAVHEPISPANESAIQESILKLLSRKNFRLLDIGSSAQWFTLPSSLDWYQKLVKSIPRAETLYLNSSGIDDGLSLIDVVHLCKQLPLLKFFALPKLKDVQLDPESLGEPPVSNTLRDIEIPQSPDIIPESGAIALKGYFPSLVFVGNGDNEDSWTPHEHIFAGGFDFRLGWQPRYRERYLHIELL